MGHPGGAPLRVVEVVAEAGRAAVAAGTAGAGLQVGGAVPSYGGPVQRVHRAEKVRPQPELLAQQSRGLVQCGAQQPDLHCLLHALVVDVE